MHIEGGTSIAYKREIENAPDPRARREEIEARLQTLASPFRNAHVFGVEDIIDPRDTRSLLVDFIEDAVRVTATMLGPRAGLSYRP
jgi:acetyl-CoA carboxylase carboxyltransferase component